MRLTLIHKSAYGNDRYYPACENSQLLLRLGRGGKLSFTPDDLVILHKLFKVKIEMS